MDMDDFLDQETGTTGGGKEQESKQESKQEPKQEGSEEGSSGDSAGTGPMEKKESHESGAGKSEAGTGGSGGGDILPDSADDMLDEAAGKEGTSGAGGSGTGEEVSKEKGKSGAEGKQESASGGSSPKNIAEEDDIDTLINQANKMISKGDFEGARKAYLRIKELKHEMPKKVAENEKKINSGLADLNEKMLHSMDQTLTSEFDRKFNRIKSLIDEAYSNISGEEIAGRKELDKTEEAYRKIKNLYSSLPEGFVEKKVMVQDQMLKLYRIIIRNKKRIISQEFKEKSDRILGLMKQIADSISNKDFSNASKLFTQATQLYKQLPKGFLKEKTDLQSRILDIYQKLVMGRENIMEDEFEKRSGEIKNLLSKAYSLVKQGRLEDAEEQYKKISEIYSQLPEGYMAEKADIEVEMMELHHIITLRRDKELMEKSKAKLNEIEMLLKTAKNYMANSEYDLAKEVYEEIIDEYNRMPKGFFEQKTKVQDEIIRLYRDILSKSPETVIQETQGEGKEKYDELLKLLVDIHTHTRKKEFSEIKNKYLAAYRLYHELPLSLIEKKKDIYREIYKIYEELRLLTSLDKLAEHAQKKEYDKMSRLLDSMAREYSVLSKKYPQDIELFRYIQSKSLVYLDMLKKRKEGAEEKTGHAVRKRIEGMAGKRDKMGDDMPQQDTPAEESHENASAGGRKGEAQERSAKPPGGSAGGEAGSKGLASGARGYLESKYRQSSRGEGPSGKS
ncbi:MAG: hypothetical protein R6U32_06360 [Candidatus Woesearchaeota archaeon]